MWMDLTSDARDGWENADVFRQWLDLETSALIPHGPPVRMTVLTANLAKIRTETGKALVDLISGVDGNCQTGRRNLEERLFSMWTPYRHRVPEENVG